MNTFIILLRLLLTSIILSMGPLSSAHVQLLEPLPRGSLSGTSRAPSIEAVDPLAPIDYFVFFPAGNKSRVPGAGKRYQKTETSKWVEFKPMEEGFPWRAGICGDIKEDTPQPHKKGGKYYYDAKISKVYQEGSVIDLKISMNRNHNGYVVFHACDIGKFGGEISADCFETKGACRLLQRAYTKLYDEDKSRTCGPIDRNHIDRWYIPCAVNASRLGGIDNYGFKDEVKYILPDRFFCEHSVLHFYYAAADNCNPPGVREYFTGSDRPTWGTCPGGGGALGQYAANQQDCGGDIFAEEYYNCADIQIVPKRISNDNSTNNNRNTGRAIGISIKKKA